MKTINMSILRPVDVSITDGWVANSEDPDQTPHSAASDLSLHCLHRPDCPNTSGKYDIFNCFKVDNGFYCCINQCCYLLYKI